MLQKEADVDEASARIEAIGQTLIECEQRAVKLMDATNSIPALCEKMIRVQQTLSKRPNLPTLPPGLMDDPADAGEEDEATDDVSEQPAAPPSQPAGPTRMLVRQATKLLGGCGSTPGSKPTSYARRASRMIPGRPQERSHARSQSPPAPIRV